MRCFVVCLLGLSCLPCLAQSAGDGNGLAVTGTQEVKLRPIQLQLTVQIEGRSSELPKAAQELERRVELAKKKLGELAAIEDSIEVSGPKLQGTGSSEQAQQMQMMMQQYGGGARGKQMLEQTQSVSVTQTIIARWQLTGDTALDRLVATKALTQKIREADVGCAGEKQPVSAAQEELAVEMEAMMEDYSYGEEQTKAGEPSFAFIAKLSAADHRDAIAAAFQKAEQEIETLSVATEIQFHRALPVSVSLGGSEYEAYYGQRGTSTAPKQDDEGNYEITANDPNEASVTVSVGVVAKHR